jgi:HSP20 family protein
MAQFRKLEEPMADSKTNRSDVVKEGGQALARNERDTRGIQRWDPSFGSFASPFEWMDRVSEEMDRAFDRISRDFGFSRRSWPSHPFGSSARQGLWSPRIEAFQKEDRFVVRAELPGLKKDDVQVELTGDALTIHGERREEHEEKREGYYHSEREYGEFRRTVPLPEGVITESARASFHDGVLEVSMQAAPSEANRGRRLEIKDASEGSQKK